MSEARCVLKHPTGFFAAGSEMRQAIGLLPDGAFKVFVHVCLNADRHTGQLRFRMAELAQATGHSVRSIATYLDELRRLEVCLVFAASNQHEYGRIEICDRYWPYVKPAGGSSDDPEQTRYVAQVRALFLSPACVQATFSAADEKLAGEWYRAGIPLDQVGRGILLGTARKYISTANHPGQSPVQSLEYFAGVVSEVAEMEVPMEYWRYLEMRVKKMESHWRAQANFAGAKSGKNQETK
jgi:hypothetical protein